jgi:hypothetical protein
MASQGINTKVLSALWLDVLTGGVDVRNQYMGVLISHIQEKLRADKLNPVIPLVVRFRTSLHKTVDTIIRNYTLGKLPLADTNREREIAMLEKYFERFIIKVDAAVADPATVEQMEIIEAMETLEHCRNLSYAAGEQYAKALTGDREGFAISFNAMNMIINELTPIVYKYSMVDVTESDYSNAARAAAKRMESGKEVAVK